MVNIATLLAADVGFNVYIKEAWLPLVGKEGIVMKLVPVKYRPFWLSYI